LGAVVTDLQVGTIQTNIPSRLDRLPWSRFHWRIVFGLGTAWVLDGLEVTMVASVGSRLTEKGAGLGLSVSQVGIAGAIYIIGACLGALFFGQMCDRFGRKKLFVITLAIYIVSTVVTAFSFAPWFFFAARFLTGAGIGGEYSAINSAIDELIPARARGRIDLMINGSYWLGSIIGSGFALFFLSAIFPKDLGWRLAFGVGAVIGLSVMFVRRKVPESPRWLFIHGREEEAEAIVDGVEQEVENETGRDLSEVDKSITVRQRKTIPFRELARVAFKLYPKRSVLCLALFVGQAFIYNGVTFNLGTLMTTFFGVGAAVVPIFLIIYAVGNLAGPLVLGRLFDTVGRKPMISGTYLGSALLAVVLAGLFVSGSLNSVTFIIVVVAVFFLASAGASAAYLTASEIFPMETRALAIAFFYAIGTAVGGISGPLLFGKLISSNVKGEVALTFLIGAAVMTIGGIAELLFGVNAAGKQLEDIAKPLTVGDAERPGPGSEAKEGTMLHADQPEPDPHRAAAGHNSRSEHDDDAVTLATTAAQLLDERAQAATEHLDAAEHRAEAGGEHHAQETTAEGALRDDETASRRAAQDRAQERIERRRARERAGLRRYRPGPGHLASSPGWAVSAPTAPAALDNEMQAIHRALDEHGATERRALAQMVGARYWGPGVFGQALREAVDEGDVRRTARSTFALSGSSAPKDGTAGEPDEPRRERG